MTQLETLSSIQRLARNACYTEGWEFYQQLTSTTPLDDQWAGVCLWNLGLLEESRTYFSRALRRNATGAAIGLAAIHRTLGELDECENHLNMAFDSNLQADDWIRALRERGNLQLARNQNKLALNSFNDARLEADLSPESKNLIPSIDQALGFINHLLGKDRVAKNMLDQAFQNADPVQKKYIRLTHALVCIFDGDFKLAAKNLEELELQGIENKFSESFFNYIKGTLYIALGHFGEAEILFSKGLETSELHQYSENISLNQLGLCKTFIGLNKLNEARAALKRAEHLEVSPEYQAARDLTAGLYWTKVGDLTKAYEHLSNALEYYKTHECARELGWTHLHFAVWHFKNGDNKAAAVTLEQVADTAGALDNTAFLIPELRLISDLESLAKIATPYGLNILKPVLETHLETSMPLEHRPEVKTFHLQAFGNAKLLANGQPVHLTSTAKTIEVIAYLMLNPMSTLEKILTDVFEDSSPKDGRNNFHQIKHQLVLHSNGLQISYDRVTRTYTLETTAATLSWDYSEIMRLISVPVDTDLNQALDLYPGAFLRHSSAEWVEEVRSNVEWLLVRTGLKVVQDLFERGDFDACRKMTERLRKVEPLDESLNELLVRATTELDGALAGRRTVAEVERTFGGYGEVLPPTLKRLREELKLTLN